MAIYAQKPPTKSSSVRPIETVIPLAAELKQEVITTYHRNEYEQLVKDIIPTQTMMKTVLISWGHGVLGRMAHAFGATDAPSVWPNVYDRVWRIVYNSDGTVTFEDLPQKLMYGDSKKIAKFQPTHSCVA